MSAPVGARQSRAYRSEFSAVLRGAHPGAFNNTSDSNGRSILLSDELINQVRRFFLSKPLRTPSPSALRPLSRHWAESPLTPGQGPHGGRRPINAKCETVHELPTFWNTYRLRRRIVSVDGFFEWKAIKGPKAKQPMPSP
jgi:hypothetical protein